MLKLNSVMVGTNKPQVLKAFYEKVFGKKPDMEDGNWAGWKLGDGFLSIGEHSEVEGESKEPERILLNLETNDVKGEYDRIANIGAEVIKELYEIEGSWIATFADPDGNYFQIMSPWKGK